MAILYYVRCIGCSCVCPAVPLTREMFYEIDRENRQLALDLAYLDCIMVYCQFNERYQSKAIELIVQEIEEAKARRRR